MTLRRVRPWIQGLSFALFLALLIAANAGRGPVPDLYFRLDPLVGITSALAGRTLIPAMGLGLVTLALTVALGRAWCGWICPLGTLLDWMPSRKANLSELDPGPRWRRVKYTLLFAILVMALLGWQTLVLLDPITLIYRTTTTAVWPAVVWLINGTEGLLYPLRPFRGPISAFEQLVRGKILPVEPIIYRLNVAVMLLFAAVLALNAVRTRFWCRYLCPLGALLGLVSKVAWMRRVVGEQCIACHRCARACPMGTIDPGRGHASDPAECTMCLDCIPTCPTADQTFRGHWALAPWQRYDPTRRHVLTTAGATIAAVGFLGSEARHVRPHPYLIRPPGAQDPGFESRCIRCGVCVRVCPTGGLQPSLTEAGWSGLMTPILVPRMGYCDYSCNACGQACPVGAIPPLALEEKRTVVIGRAYIDRSRCIPWVDAHNCIVCEEMCPIPDKAIQLEEVDVWAPDGQRATVKRPHVIAERCIGCGICENHCPLNGEAAIRVRLATEFQG